MVTRTNLFGIPVDTVSLREAQQIVIRFMQDERKCHPIYSLNANKVYLVKKGYIPVEVFEKASLILPDGISIVYAFGLSGHRIQEVAAGVDLMLSLIEIANENELSVFFLGSPQSLLKRVIDRCNRDYPHVRIAGFQHGYYSVDEEDRVVSRIGSVAPDILFVAFGSPRKELFVHKYQHVLNAKVAMAVGGSYEVFVGNKKRGPAWRQKLGLEWLNRLLQDPRRLWKRYLITNSAFIYYLMKEYFFRGGRNNEL